MPPIRNDWAKVLAPEYNKPYYRKLFDFIGKEYSTHTIYPPGDDIFNAFHLTPLKDVKCVIIGQDPYHGPGQAHGLSFSVQDNVKIPPSLQNIYKELYSDLGIPPKNTGNLTGWAKEGVLLLNSTLTVEKDKANSHQGLGWQYFTDYVIKVLNLSEKPIVFILWGNFARSKKSLITNPKHLILESPHPSPFSAYNGFFGSKPFSKTNDFLIKNNIKPIDWSK